MDSVLLADLLTILEAKPAAGAGLAQASKPRRKKKRDPGDIPPEWLRGKKSKTGVPKASGPAMSPKARIRATLDHMSQLAHIQTRNAENLGTDSAYKLAAHTHARVAHAAKVHGHHDLVRLHHRHSELLSKGKSGAAKLRRQYKQVQSGPLHAKPTGLPS
jgi:hypothetical protein